jgi:hypothetical protein
VATYLTGAQTTGVIEQAERRIDIPNKLIWLRPNVAPVVKLSMGRSSKGLPIKKERAINPEYIVIEKQPHAQWTAINDASNYTAGDTALTLDDISFIKVGHILVDTTSDELLYVSAVNYSTKVATVTRGFGATAAGAITDNDMLYVMGHVAEENSSLPGALTIKNRKITNYLHTFRWPFALSNTLRASGLHTGAKEQELRKESYYEAVAELERIFLFSEPSEDLTGGPNSNPIRTTGGCKYWIETGGGLASDAGGAFTKAEWTTFRRLSTEYTTEEEYLVGLFPGLLIEGLSLWKDGALQMRPIDENYNIKVAEWVDGFGQLFAIHHKELKNGGYGATGGYGGLAFVLSPNELAYRYLSGNGLNRDLAYYPDVLKTGVDGLTGEYKGEIGLDLRLAEKHNLVYGITSVTA